MKLLTSKIGWIIVAGFSLLVASCTVTEPAGGNFGDPIDAALQNSIANNNKLKHKGNRQKALPSQINKALMPEISVPQTKVGASDEASPESQRFDISVSNVPAKDFFMGLVKDTKYNMTVSPDVSGNISLELKNVTVPQVIEAVNNAYGFEYEKTSYGYQILPRKLETRVFTVNYLDIDRGGKSQTTIGSGQITRTIQSTVTSGGTTSGQQNTSMPSGVIETSSHENFWEQLKANLTAIIGSENGHSVVVNQQSGVVIVRAFPDELRSIATYLDNIEDNMERQVIIEAKVIEVDLNADYLAGINWKAFGISAGVGDSTVNSVAINSIAQDLPVFTSIFTIRGADGGAFNTMLQFLNTQGKTNVLSSPRIATTNNQKAVIKVGNDRFYVTNVSSDSSNTVSGANTQTQNIDLTPFFSGIALDVTPQINPDGYITLHIHPVISNVTQDRQQFVVNGYKQDLPLAQSSVRESDSIVRAQDGQVVVIGGLMENKSSDYTAGAPGVDKFKFFGNLFRSTHKTAQKTELVILLRPVLVHSSKEWQKSLSDAANTVRGMKGDFSYNIVKTKNELKCDNQ